MDIITKTKTKHSVIIVVNNKKFLFDAKQLTDNSAYFEKMLNGSFKESEQKEIVLIDVDLEEFQFFRDWLFGIRTSFKGLNRDFLLRLVLLVDRFMLNQFRKECHESVKFWLDKDISFPSKVLETAMFIGDQQLKDIFIAWLNKEMKIPFGKWTLRDVTSSSDAVIKFMNKKLELLTLEAPKNVKTEFKTIVFNFLDIIVNKRDYMKKLLTEYQEERRIWHEKMLEIWIYNAENIDELMILQKEYEKLHEKITGITNSVIGI